jgi:hypothetical protein
MHPHDSWLELAALDALGELTAEERQALEAHLRTCGDCRTAASIEAGVAGRLLPLASGEQPVRDSAAEEASRRNAFLSRARAEGLRFSTAAAQGRRSWPAWVPGWNLVPVAATVGVVVLAFVAGSLFVSRPAAFPGHTGAVDSRTPIAELARENEQLRRELEAGRRETETASERLAAAHTQTVEARQQAGQLQKSLASAQKQSVADREAFQRTRAEVGDAASRLAAEQQQFQALLGQLEQVRAAHAADRTALAARQDEVEELNRQVRLQAANVDRARDLLTADRDIRDLMAARNLHIVDVHDTDARGKTKKAFGRMFYTEGKSLIFYAYDLDSPRVTNASFQVWGQKTGKGDDAISLGLLYSDDQKQSRWVMKFDNPKVLSEIDSVFVTVEAPGGSTKPSNQRTMYAYLLNAANHQ